jgi:hypothetical protein
MEFQIVKQFILISLNPANGRIIPDSTRFRYSLSGAILMDLFLNGEIVFENKRISSSVKKSGNPVHDLVADIMARSSRPRRVSYWINLLTRKRRVIFREIIHSLTDNGLIRHEKRYFLNIIPINRYYVTDTGARTKIIEELRNILLFGKTPTQQQNMLIGLIKASESYKTLARETGEKRIIKSKCKEFLKTNPFATEVDKVLQEIQAAIIASVAISAATASASHH